MARKRIVKAEMQEDAESASAKFLVAGAVDTDLLLVDRRVGRSRSNDSKKYQIFVSSTYTDLVDERRAVTEVILSMGHIPVGMELFEAGNEDQWSYIKNRILEVDYYLLILAERYGSIGPGGLSYTEMEYRYAIEQGVPVAALLLDQARRDQWPAGKIDFDNRKKLNLFRELCKSRMVAFWSDAGTLTTRCQLALSGLFRRSPQIGWVSADQAVSPQMSSELARLSSENSELRSQLAQFQRDGTVSKELDVTVERLVEPFQKQIERAARRFQSYNDWLKEPAVSQMLLKCNLFDYVMEYPEPLFDGCSDDVWQNSMLNYIQVKMREIQTPADDFTSKVARPLIGIMGLLYRSWGLVETFLINNPGVTPVSWVRLSALGRRAFNEALGQFLDNTNLTPDAGLMDLP